MSVFGAYLKDFTHPVCTEFKPKLLDGQVCYSLDMKGVSPQYGKSKGLSFLMDYNFLRHMEPQEGQERTSKNTERGLSALIEERKTPEAKIYINLIEPFIGKFYTKYLSMYFFKKNF